MRGKELEDYKKGLKLSKQQKNIIVGTLLGDATLCKIKKGMKNCHIKFEQSIKNKEYIESIYEVFKDWCGTSPKIRNIKGGGANDRQSIHFRTYAHKELLFYYNQFYKEIEGKRIKVVPSLLDKWLNDEVLAYWFMDDGSKTGSGYVINTQGFAEYEQKAMQKALGKRFSIQTSLWKDKNKYMIYIGTGSKYKFTEIIKPYMHGDFNYKLHLKKESNEKIIIN